MEIKQIFTNKADLYKKYRPQYAEKLFSFLQALGIFNESTIVADVGCGTGIFSNQLLDKVATIYGVEPNTNMLKNASEMIKSSRFIPINGSAENTTLDANSVDLVTAAQAFHWFQPDGFKKECVRILKQNGKVLLLWNRKKSCEMEIERKKIVNHYFHVLDSYDCSWEKREKGIAQFFNGKFEVAKFDNDLVNDYEQFIGRTLSASHAIEQDNEAYSEYLKDWENYFYKYEKDGIITIPNETIAFWGSVGR